MPFAVSGATDPVVPTGPVEPIRSSFRSAAAGAMMCSLMVFLMVASSLSPFIGVTDVDDSEPLPGHSLNMMSVTLTTSATLSSPAYVGEPVTFYATGTSDIADVTITFQIFFNATLPGPVNNTESPYEILYDENPGSVETTYTYDEPGCWSGSSGTYYIAVVWATDGVTVMSASRIVYVIENRDPYFSPEPQPAYDAVKDVPININTTVFDADDDTLVVDWDFGDGTEHGTNVTGPAEGGVYVSQVHAWSPYVEPGEGEYYVYYELNITLDDGQDNIVSFLSTIRIWVPRNGVPTVAISGPFRADPSDAVPFAANATDREGEPLTWTFDFGDGTIEVYHTDATAPSTLVWMNVTHVFGVIGNFTVRVYVTDVVYPNVVLYHNVSSKVDIRIAVNVLPAVQEKISVSSDNPMIQSAIGGVVVKFTLDVLDSDGDVLTAVWDFGDGTDSVTNVTPGGTKTYRLTQYHNFTVPGSPNITVEVTDGRLGHEVLRYRIINVSLNNSGPKFVGVAILYPAETGDFVVPNGTVGVSGTIKDAELDTLYVTVKFGDGTPWVNLSLSEFVNGNATFSVNHSYTRTGEYSLSIVVTDGISGLGKHTVYSNLTVKVQEIRVEVKSVWSWWDYTCLGIAFALPVLIIAWMVLISRRHRMLEDAGVTVEQYMARKREISRELRQRQKEGGL